jgi:chemotaxis protein CheD
MKSRFSHLPVIYLHPGEVFFGSQPTLVTTVLGSCLSITMFSRKHRYSGISHCQLPSCSKYGGDCVKCPEPYRYVECTIEKMLETFGRLKIKRNEIEVKVFGGADVIGNKQDKINSKTIGRQNIAAAINSINGHNLSISASDTGGIVGRKLYFVTDSGDIFLKKLNTNEKD